MRDLPAHLDPERIPESWKPRVLTPPVFSHPLAMAGYQAHPCVESFAANVKAEIRACYRLATRDPEHAEGYRAVAAEYTRWAREEGLI